MSRFIFFQKQPLEVSVTFHHCSQNDKWSLLLLLLLRTKSDPCCDPCYDPEKV